ncbi:hypothetical protein WOLCODRAFT_163046 [Wolfiporia cocos MD-104 SS10]|uniref:RRM domain-containing protein n=1 Tax=Wolfiporia cocos (strain MD-104) TaxID=742152 RepID=A0A2H3JZ11_WOLCO|nr:hypothetical protein WOLCODRAFT_163046 [Wolfiporia cocos MD-104 SS10]
MGRYRCPDSSDSETYDNIPIRLASMTISQDWPAPDMAGPSSSCQIIDLTRPPDKIRTGKIKDKGKGKMRDKGKVGATLKQRERVRMARKQERVRSASDGKRTANYSFVFVGNLDRSISREVLEQHFRRCGQLYRVTIRTAGGSPDARVPAHANGTADRLYASVEFRDAQAAARALKFDGATIRERKIVVSLNAADLPEIKGVGDPPKKKPAVNLHQPFDVKRAFVDLKRITVDKTHYNPATQQAGPSRPGPSRAQAGPSSHFAPSPAGPSRAVAHHADAPRAGPSGRRYQSPIVISDSPPATAHAQPRHLARTTALGVSFPLTLT